MSKLYAYARTMAGAERLARQRPPPCKPQLPEPETSTVVKLIPRTEAQQIIADIARKYGVTYADMRSRDLSKHVVTARHEAIVAVKAAKPHLSLVQIGRLFHRD